METLYKYSQFNITAKETDDKLLLYNTYTSKGRWISRVDYDDIIDKDNIDLGDVSVRLAEDGFIVERDTDETAYAQAIIIKRHMMRMC